MLRNFEGNLITKELEAGPENTVNFGVKRNCFWKTLFLFGNETSQQVKLEPILICLKNKKNTKKGNFWWKDFINIKLIHQT